jgi:2-dehydro-3-deoxygluconokinase
MARRGPREAGVEEMAQVPDVITFGEALILFAPEGTGPLRHVDRFIKSVVGAEVNFAIGVSRLGLSSGWFGRTGDDEFGAQVLACLRADGVDTSRALVDGAGPTAVMFKEYRGFGDPKVIYYRKNSAASRLSPSDLDRQYLTGSRCLHITGITAALSDSCREAVHAVVSMAKAAGVPVSFDPNVRRKLMPLEGIHDLLLPLVNAADILLIGLDEGELLFGVKGGEAVLAEALTRGPRTVVVKMGASGALAGEGTEQVREPAFPVDAVVDTVGAGDGFGAGFIAGRLKGLDLRTSVRLGAIVGAAAVTVRGDYEGYPTWAEASGLLGLAPRRDAR